MEGNLICKGVKINQVIMVLSWIYAIYWFAIHAGKLPAALANISTNNSILSACVVFRVQSVLQPHLNFFNSCDGAAWLVISINIISFSVSCQPHFKRSSALSSLQSCI